MDSRAQDDGAAPAVDRVARDTHAQRLGLVLAIEGRRARLRSLATGRVWETDVSALRRVTAREELSMRLAAVNARAEQPR
jgi:hypothetical protein